MVTPTILIILLVGWSLGGIQASPLIGPADVIVKFTERCNMTLPTLIDYNVRVVQRRGKTFLNTTATVPHKFSDKMGYEIAVSVKRNGVWKPNFFKTRGEKLCSAVKNTQKEFFDLMAKDLKAPKPYNCPLPSGSYAITDFPLDFGKTAALIGNALPYGEFKAELTMTNKGDIVWCQLFYADIVPKSTKKKGK